jgi:hypothetical protein
MVPSRAPGVSGVKRTSPINRTCNHPQDQLRLRLSRHLPVFHYIGNAVDQKAAFSPKSGEPRWRDAVKIWNQNADRMDDVSYKVCTNTYLENLSISLTLNSKLIELLKVYYTKWKLLSHVKETLSLSADAQKLLSLVIHVPLRSTRAPAIPHNQLRLHHATKGLLDISTTPSNSTSANSGTFPRNL